MSSSSKVSSNAGPVLSSGGSRRKATSKKQSRSRLSSKLGLELFQLLKALNPNLSKIHEQTGVHFNTVRAARDGSRDVSAESLFLILEALGIEIDFVCSDPEKTKALLQKPLARSCLLEALVAQQVYLSPAGESPTTFKAVCVELDEVWPFTLTPADVEKCFQSWKARAEKQYLANRRFQSVGNKPTTP